jgi:hypothetical protein
METIRQIYHNLFPSIGIADWIYAIAGMLLHGLIKLKNIPFKTFKLKIFLEDFLVVWLISLLSIFICMGTLPQLFPGYSTLDSALIGYSSSSILRSVFNIRSKKLPD